MTIEIVPASSAWRDAYRVPKDLQLEDGPWCSMDLRAGLLPEQNGWICPSCGAWWDRFGRNGRWITAASAVLVDGHFIERDEPDTEPVEIGGLRLDRAAPLVVLSGVVLGGGYAAGRAMRSHADAVPEALLLGLSLIVFGLLLIGAGALLAWRWWTGRTDGGDR
ncbi:hypothetical protein [Actinoplanes subglobosus]|uniref:Uncharacterized protein n=1 Tax=Actinoplanes subglobosus TaxID=1547892 RepID=A0ABV8IV57_9ACTN